MKIPNKGIKVVFKKEFGTDYYVMIIENEGKSFQEIKLMNF